MAKAVPKVKKRPISFRSRAARRGAEPDTKPISKPANNTTASEKAEVEYKPWLHAVQNGGVSKKKKAKPLTTKQRVRLEKAQAKADAVTGRTERNLEISRARSKTVQHRAKDWEELNGEIEGETEGKAGAEGMKEVKLVGVGKLRKDVGGEEGMQGVELLGEEAGEATAKKGLSDAEMDAAAGADVEEAAQPDMDVATGVDEIS